MITFTLNGQPAEYTGDPSVSLLSHLRNDKNLTAAKDGCSGQAACGACLVELDGKACLSCSTPMSKVEGKAVVTLEGFPESLRKVLGTAFVNAGAVQCGFCTPGFLTRAKILLQTNPKPTREEVTKAVRPHLCRCTGYVKLVDAILDAAAILRGDAAPKDAAAILRGDAAPKDAAAILRGDAAPKDAAAILRGEKADPGADLSRPGMGSNWPKYGGYDRALGQRPFVEDLRPEGMLHGALVFSAHPRARIKSINTAPAMAMPGVQAVFTAREVPGNMYVGMFIKDWPVYVGEGEVTRYIGDVLACVVADTEAHARAAVKAVAVDYEVLEPLLDMELAEDSPIRIHPEGIHKNGNVLVNRRIVRGEEGVPCPAPIDDVLARCAHTVEAVYTTQAVEHAFIEPEASVAMPEGEGLRVYVQAQGIYHDRHDLATFLNIPEERITVTLCDAGGAFGGKEDMTCQGHAALAAFLLQRPVKVRLSRPESIRMHPKRHGMKLTYTLGCDEKGLLQAAKVRILADTGAYASAGGPVVTRTGTHATSAYHVPNVDVHIKAVFTNNLPAGAFRGFGVNQSNFAMESAIDELCAKAGFDRWQFRYDNAAREGSLLTTGQKLEKGASALRETLLAVKPAYDAHPRNGLACAVKNAGIGNGIPEPTDVFVVVKDDGSLEIRHGWTEMGQGIHTVARQMLCEVAGLGADVPIHVASCTSFGAYAGSTTASRGTFQLGHAVVDAATQLRDALKEAGSLQALAGQTFKGHYDTQNRTSETGAPGKVRNHISYSFSTNLVLMDEAGRIEKIIAAHDSGNVVNRPLYEGQVEGGVVMGLGYATTESIPTEGGYLTSEKFNACGLPRSTDVPPIEVIPVELPDPEGPCGAKGIGEISCIAIAPALAAGLYAVDGVRRRSLPMGKLGK